MGFLRRSKATRLKKAGDVEGLYVLAENGDAKERFEALYALVDLERDAPESERLADVARRALVDPSAGDVRGAGAFILGQLRVRDAVPALLETLDDPKWYPRATAACALGRLAPPEAFDRLIQMAETDDDDLVRDQATYALAEYPEGAETLRRLDTDAARYALSKFVSTA
jgi:HEAT repeat protein